MDNIKKLQFIETNLDLIKIYAAPLLLLAVAAVCFLVYQTGGIKFVYSHSMYIPIVIAGFVYGIRGGVLFGMIGGLVLGPYMPIDVVTQEMQQPINWLYRTGFFILIGLLAGLASDAVKDYIRNLKWLTRHDNITNLLNRVALVEDLPRLAKQHEAPNLNLLLVASLNNTRHLKTAYGYEVLDSAVEQVSQRFRSCLDEIKHEYEIYRADAGSISAVITDAETDKVNSLLDKLSNMARQPFDIFGIPVHVDFRMGFVPFTDIPSDPALYLRHAEAAMNHAHENRKDFAVFSQDHSVSARENLTVLGELAFAIENGQLALHYQPKIDIRHGHVSSVEALMRWNHPDKGTIPPGVFIPCAENSTLIGPLTFFAIEAAAKQIIRWQKKGVRLPIAVNISPFNLNEYGFANSIIDILKKYEVAPEFIELEMTESALMHDIERCTAELKLLDEFGLSISVDDFGTGYSSLQYLHALPMSIIKIDQSFIKHLPSDDTSIHIVEASISMAHNLGMKVVAEGVENEAAYDFLKASGCDYAQGYLFSRPLAETDFLEWYYLFKSETPFLI